MDTILKILNIDSKAINKIKNDNELLMKNESKVYDRLSQYEKHVIYTYKGPPHGIDQYGLKGYRDYYNFFLDKDKFYTIDLKDVRLYITLFKLNNLYDNIYDFDINNLDVKLRKIIRDIAKIRCDNIIKNIHVMNSVINKGIHYNGFIYRVMRTPFKGNIINNFTSWSLYPQFNFADSNEIHLYVTKMSKKMKAFYVEYDGDDKNLQDLKNFPYYEYELILPTNLEFTIKKIKKFKVNDTKNFFVKNKKDTRNDLYVVNIYWIKFTGIQKNVKLDKFNIDGDDNVFLKT
jgi:hypothetical protein